MTLSPGSTAVPADPAVRSRLYRLLALGLRYPSAQFFDAWRDGRFVGEIRDAAGALPHMSGISNGVWGTLSEMRMDMGTTSLRDLETGYAQTFDVGAPEPPCPPYEGVHRKGVERTVILLEVSGFYKHFGLGMNPDEGKRDLPDHLCAELEFLHFLTFKEAQARDQAEEVTEAGQAGELLGGYILAQKDFLERHLLTWVPQFAEKVGQATPVPLYGALVRIAAEFVRRERDLVDGYLTERQE